MVDQATTEAEKLREPFSSALQQALEVLAQARLREGAALRTALLERCDGIDRILADLRVQVPAILAMMGRKLQERMSRTVYASGCKSWYLDESGKGTILWPGLSSQYWRDTRRLMPSEYVLGKAVQT